MRVLPADGDHRPRQTPGPVNVITSPIWLDQLVQNITSLPTAMDGVLIKE